MFHVERFKPLFTLILFYFFINCGVAKPRIEIDDYVLLPNGKSVLNKAPLNAFVFENSLKNIDIQQYLATKFNTPSTFEKEFSVIIDKNKFKLLIYDKDEFDKYFNTNLFIIKNQENDADIQRNYQKFIAISVVDDKNQDCLLENALYQQIILNYLKQLKNDYLHQLN